MDLRRIYYNLGSFLLDLLPDVKWVKAELHIKIQPKMLGTSGRYYTLSDVKTVRAKFDDELKKDIKWLHKCISGDGRNKWNRAIFKLTPDEKFEMEFDWDSDWQDEIDENNRKAMLEDPNYISPKWYWEE